MARLHLCVALIVASLVLASAKKSGDVTELQIGYKPKSCTIQAHKGDRIKVHYRGSLTNGEVFDSSFERGDPIEFELGSGQVIKGWDQGLLGMCVGERRKLKIPAKLGYGAQGSPPKIPGGATLVFDTELVAVNGKPSGAESELKGEIFITPEMYCEQPDQLLDLNWNQGRSPGSHLESAMSSIVPSRSSAAADGVTFHKLMGGRLPSAVDGASEQFRLIDVRLNSPNKLNLSMPKSNECLPLPGIPMPVSLLDQFSGQSYGHHSAQLGLIGSEKLSRVSVPQIGLPEGRKDASAVGRLRLDINNGELINGREESSASDPAASEAVSSGGPSKKRKAPPKDKVMGPGIASSSIDPTNAMEEEDPSAKRRRSMEKKGTETDAVKPKAEENYGCSSNGYNGQKQGKENSSKSAEPLKSYIHVRSRRGQATDSHSLAERVRREKISQRMKLLQDLVPGCNKVTGKAVMLDEIINYVQSLQRQVEFLSMKLATVNPQLDFNLETLLPKAMQQACEPMRNSVYALETSESTAQHINHPRQGTFLHCVLPNDMEIHNSLNILEPKFYGSTHQPFVYGFDTTSSQFQQGSFWEDDLQNAACMDIGHN